jgi:hypothetical protein
MENNNNSYAEGENMILCHIDNAASREFNMPPVETLMEEYEELIACGLRLLQVS